MGLTAEASVCAAGTMSATDAASAAAPSATINAKVTRNRASFTGATMVAHGGTPARSGVGEHHGTERRRELADGPDEPAHIADRGDQLVAANHDLARSFGREEDEDTPVDALTRRRFHCDRIPGALN